VSDPDVVRFFVTSEIDYAKDCVSDWDELEALTEAGLEMGGHWGPDAERYEELLCGCTITHAAFRPTPWWRFPGSILDRLD
jgi:hypothetical protein